MEKWRTTGNIIDEEVEALLERITCRLKTKQVQPDYAQLIAIEEFKKVVYEMVEG